MISPSEQLFVQLCMHDLERPVSFPQMPQFQQLYDMLDPEQQKLLYKLMDVHALGFSEYGSACFDQGIRFAFSLVKRLYPHLDGTY